MRQALSLFVLLAFLVSLVSLASCAATPLPGECMQEWRTLPFPVGAWYTSHAAEWEREHLPQGLAEILLGACTDGEGRPLYEDFCIFLSADAGCVCELVAVACYTAAAANALAEHLAMRLARLLREADEDTRRDAAVRIKGNTVIYAITPCNAAVFSVLRRRSTKAHNVKKQMLSFDEHLLFVVSRKKAIAVGFSIGYAEALRTNKKSAQNVFVKRLPCVKGAVSVAD